MKTFLIKLLQRTIPILAFAFPFMEISYYFGAKVFLNSDNLDLKIFYAQYIVKIARFYAKHVYLIFIVMILYH